MKNARSISDPSNDAELLLKIAKIEARSLKLVSIKELVAATGLTEHQVRARRERPIYKTYLEKAKKQQIIASKASRLTKKSPECGNSKPLEAIRSDEGSTSTAPTRTETPSPAASNNDKDKEAIPTQRTSKRHRNSATPPDVNPTKRPVPTVAPINATPRSSKRQRPETPSPQ